MSDERIEAGATRGERDPKSPPALTKEERDHATKCLTELRDAIGEADLSWVEFGYLRALAELERQSDLLEAAKLQVLNFERTMAGGGFLGDDDHEAWAELSAAIAKAEGK